MGSHDFTYKMTLTGISINNPPPQLPYDNTVLWFDSEETNVPLPYVTGIYKHSPFEITDTPPDVNYFTPPTSYPITFSMPLIRPDNSKLYNISLSDKASLGRTYHSAPTSETITDTYDFDIGKVVFGRVGVYFHYKLWFDGTSPEGTINISVLTSKDGENWDNLVYVDSLTDEPGPKEKTVLVISDDREYRYIRYKVLCIPNGTQTMHFAYDIYKHLCWGVEV